MAVLNDPIILDSTGQQIVAALGIQNKFLGISGAGLHNSLYRGKSLGTAVTEAQWAAITAGTFEDMYIGDYWTIGGVNWRIADFDYWLRSGDTECTAHHVVVVPDTCLYNAKMNDENVVTGGYMGSKMYTENLDSAKTTINTAFGSAHVLSHKLWLTNAVTNGKATGGAWVASTVDLMTEEMVYGGGVFHPVSDGTSVPANYRIGNAQLSLFRLDHSKITNRAYWWLRDVVSGTNFALVSDNGIAAFNSASHSLGVRPAFGIC